MKMYSGEINGGFENSLDGELGLKGADECQR